MYPVSPIAVVLDDLACASGAVAVRRLFDEAGGYEVQTP
jgi:hypothetical protein